MVLALQPTRRAINLLSESPSFLTETCESLMFCLYSANRACYIIVIFLCSKIFMGLSEILTFFWILWILGDSMRAQHVKGGWRQTLLVLLARLLNRMTSRNMLGIFLDGHLGRLNHRFLGRMDMTGSRLDNGLDVGKGAPMSCSMIYWGNRYDEFYDMCDEKGLLVW